MDDANKVVADRRNFFKRAGATAVGVGATVATAGVAAAKPAEARPADAMYRETDHVKRYYELAR